jgi:hypothetical protein
MSRCVRGKRVPGGYGKWVEPAGRARRGEGVKAAGGR